MGAPDKNLGAESAVNFSGQQHFTLRHSFLGQLSATEVIPRGAAPVRGAAWSPQTSPHEPFSFVDFTL